jgi:hypothetical protein
MMQLAVLRNDGQLLDAGLVVGRRTIYGAIATLAGLALAVAAFLLTHDVVLMLAALVCGRLIGSIQFPRLVGNLATKTSLPIWAYLSSASIIAGAYLLGQKIVMLNWLELFGAALVFVPTCMLAAYFLILSPQTRSEVSLRPRRWAR